MTTATIPPRGGAGTARETRARGAERPHGPKGLARASHGARRPGRVAGRARGTVGGVGHEPKNKS